MSPADHTKHRWSWLLLKKNGHTVPNQIAIVTLHVDRSPMDAVDRQI